MQMSTSIAAAAAAAALGDSEKTEPRKRKETSAATAALKAEQTEKEGVAVFLPLLCGYLNSFVKLSQKKHDIEIEHLSIQFKISVILTSKSGRRRRNTQRSDEVKY